MKWFKHFTDAYNNEKLSRIVETFGLEGYGFWWRLLEIVAAKIDESDETTVVFSAKKWGSLFGLSAKKFERMAEVFAQHNLILLDFCPQGYVVNIPNLLKYRDEWTKRKARNSGVAPNALRCKEKETEADTETEAEAEQEVDPVAAVCEALQKRKRMVQAFNAVPCGNAPSPSAAPASSTGQAVPASSQQVGQAPSLPDFNTFFQNYPKYWQGDIQEAQKVWIDLAVVHALPTAQVLYRSLNRWYTSVEWNTHNGKFIPSAAEFLRQQKWLQEPAQVQ